jgi:ribosome maturation factor RimP
MEWTMKDLWEFLSQKCAGLGLELFDVEDAGGVLRVYISKVGAQVTIDDCANLSNQITDDPKVDLILPGDKLLEVSSPGVNRKLSRLDHFIGALNERVRIKYSSPETSTKVVRGTVTRVENDTVVLDEEEKGETLRIPFKGIKEARVDFKFPGE